MCSIVNYRTQHFFYYKRVLLIYSYKIITIKLNYSVLSRTSGDRSFWSFEPYKYFFNMVFFCVNYNWVMVKGEYGQVGSCQWFGFP